MLYNEVNKDEKFQLNAVVANQYTQVTFLAGYCSRKKMFLHKKKSFNYNTIRVDLYVRPNVHMYMFVCTFVNL